MESHEFTSEALFSTDLNTRRSASNKLGNMKQLSSKMLGNMQRLSTTFDLVVHILSYETYQSTISDSNYIPSVDNAVAKVKAGFTYEDTNGTSVEVAANSMTTEYEPEEDGSTQSEEDGSMESDFRQFYIISKLK